MAEAQPAPSGGSSRYVTDRADITRTFRTLRDQRVRLALRFEHEARSFSARLLDVDIGHFLLDDIKPRDGLSLLHRRVPFTFTARNDGIYVFADDLSVAGAESERGVPYFLVPLPPRILTQQRRRAARFKLPLAVGQNDAEITLYRKDASLTGHIVDISAGGCRAEFAPPAQNPFMVDEAIERCRIVVPQLLDLSARSVIRHHTRLTNPPRVSCGIEFTAMDVTDRRRLEMFIQRITEGSAGIQTERV